MNLYLHKLTTRLERLRGHEYWVKEEEEVESEGRAYKRRKTSD